MVKRYLSCLICFLGAIEWGMIDTYKDNTPYPKIDVTKKSFIWLNIDLSVSTADRGNINDQFRLNMFLEDI